MEINKVTKKISYNNRYQKSSAI